LKYWLVTFRDRHIFAENLAAEIGTTISAVEGLIFDAISLDYHHTLQAASGQRAEDALDAAVEAAARPGGTPATDEAQAVEASGARPRLVRGDPRNLKVTWPADVGLAECFLQHFTDTR
jgi:hypothetical protein